MLLNNMCESFNATILRARSLPIIDILESIRTIFMKRIHVKRDNMRKYHGEICPNIQRQVEESKKKSMEFIAHWNGMDQFEIAGCYGDKFKVNIAEKTCSCRRWQLNGIPYAHAISAMYFMGYTPEDFVDEVYHKKTYMTVYSYLIDTLEGVECWPKSGRLPLQPPDIENMPGRPKLQLRRKQAGETKDIPPHVSGKTVTTIGKLGRQGLVMTCGLCKGKKHNALGCPLRGEKVQKPRNV